MTTGVTDELAVRMAGIEKLRIILEKDIGMHAAIAETLRQLNEVLACEQQALERHPYGQGHAWNEWAIQVAIEKLRREHKFSG